MFYFYYFFKLDKNYILYKLYKAKLNNFNKERSN